MSEVTRSPANGKTNENAPLATGSPCYSNRKIQEDPQIAHKFQIKKHSPIESQQWNHYRFEGLE